MPGQIGRLVRVPLREVWAHEAIDFTRWLVDNSDVITELTGIALSNLEPEHSAGTFAVDIRAEDENGNAVVIENQLGKTDHDHLGKLVTYVAMTEAKTAIWIASQPRPEHTEAVTWLNKSGGASFYLLKLEAVRIGDSAPAPMLTLITGPGEGTEEIKKVNSEIASRLSERRDFWSNLLARMLKSSTLFRNISPSTSTAIWTGSGLSAVVYWFSARQNDTDVQVYIDREDGDENLRIFNALKAHQGEIERDFGAPLVWEPLDEKKACRIKYVIDKGGYRTPEQWAVVHDLMIDAMIRLERAFKPKIAVVREQLGL